VPHLVVFLRRRPCPPPTARLQFIWKGALGPDWDGYPGETVPKKDPATGKLMPRSQSWCWSDQKKTWYSSKQRMDYAEKGKTQETHDKSGHCSECDKNFVDIGRHQKHVHGPKDQCAVCYKFFVNLRNHMKTMHPEALAAQLKLKADENPLRADVAKRSLDAAASASAAAGPKRARRT